MATGVCLQDMHKSFLTGILPEGKKRASHYLKTNSNIEFFLNGRAGQGGLSAPSCQPSCHTNILSSKNPSLPAQNLSLSSLICFCYRIFILSFLWMRSHKKYPDVIKGSRLRKSWQWSRRGVHAWFPSKRELLGAWERVLRARIVEAWSGFPDIGHLCIFLPYRRFQWPLHFWRCGYPQGT